MDSTPTPATRPGQPGLPRSWTPHSVQDPLVGATLKGRYVVDEPIGEGGMSRVYRGRDRQLRGPVAIKVLHHRGAEARRRFVAEAELLVNLDHPHIVDILDRGETPEDDPFLILEFLAGVDLNTHIETHGPLAWRDAVAIGVQAAAAVAAMYARGAVHRDLKPSNLMLLTAPGEPPLVKVVDLGCAHLGEVFLRLQDRRFTPVTRHKTHLGHVVGTPDYFPPEANEREADAGFDVYALGVTLYRLCTGRLPRETGSAPLHEVYPAGGVPPDLSRLIATAIAADPAERLPSADHLRRGLEALLIAHSETRRDEHLFAGTYDRLEVLGVGASATAFRAYDRGLDRELAIKILRKDRPDEDDVIRFERAAKILAHLRHPNIPAVHHSGWADGQRFVALELCTGVPATESVYPHAHLRVREAILVGQQLASALQAVHAAGLVYRDLHAGNVLVDLGRTPKAWLFDFDHALVSPEFWASLPQRWATPPERRRELSRDRPLHTTYYAAPEVKTGGPFTRESDVWALGLLLYRLLTGRRPFPPNGGEATPPSELCRCPDALDGVLLLMLDPDPRERPSLGHVRDLLEVALAELDAEDAPPAAAEPATTTKATSVAEEPTAVVPPATTETVAPPTSEPVEAPPSRIRPSRWRWLALAGVSVLVALIAFTLRRESPPPAHEPTTRHVVPAPASPSPPLAAPTIPTLDEALATAEDPLRRCAQQAGVEVVVELRADPGADAFTSIIVMSDEPAIDRCFHDVLAPLRFTPTTSLATRVPRYRP